MPQPRDDKNPNIRAMEALELMKPMVDMLAGMKSQMIDAGFSPEAAEEMVMTMFRKQFT